MAEVNRLPIICGPTASGKTAAALDLARRFRIDVVSADSRQMIRRLDIGTAKPTAEEQQQVRFHLVDIIEPGERYSAFRFIDYASAAIDECLRNDHLPLVVGGTGLYLRALSDGVVEMDREDMEIRERLEKECAEGGAERLYEQLKQIDPLEAAKIHPNNHVRLVRALEIFYVTGVSKSELAATGSYRRSKYTFVYYCLTPDREELYNRINRRVDAMVDQGLLEEVRQLAAEGLAEAVRKANVIGYNELLDYFEGDCSLEEAVLMIKQNTRRYAKRQLTWFRGQAGALFFPNAGALLESLCAEFAQELSRFEKT